MAEHPYMPFFPEKFFADTLHLPWDARAVYLELLALAWNRGGALPNDEDKLRRMVGCRLPKWRSLWRYIEPFWVLGEDGKWHQKRLDREWSRAATWRQNFKVLNTIGSQSEQYDGKKSSKINGPPQNPRTRARTHTHTQNSLPYGRENSEGSPASLSVRAHASPDAPSPTETTEPSPPMDDATRAHIAEGLEKLAASIASPERVTEPAAGTVAELERQAAAAKLAEWAASSALPPLSPAALATRLARVNGHGAALPKALAAPIKQKRRNVAKVH